MEPGEGVQTFVYRISGFIFVVLDSFAINVFLQYRRIGPWRGCVFGEFVYILFSLRAKSLLAWQTYAGTLQPN